MEYIKSRLSNDIAKKIIGNQDNAKKYLIRLNIQSPVSDIKFKIVRSGINKGEKRLDLTTQELWKVVVDSWDYEKSKMVIRDMFKESKKYTSGKEADKAMDLLIGEWEKLRLGNIAWPFSQGAFDDFVQRINAEISTGEIKDEKVKLAAVKYRRIKEINTVRNDFIETLIFEKNKNILPTLSHVRGVDFFIDGVSYDQKVAKSPTAEFKRKYGENWKQKAISNPELVAQYLYQYQDEGRFGADPRLLVVFLDEDITVEKIREIINNTDLQNPIEINFTFNHRAQGQKSYKVPCFIVLLHN